MDAERGYDLVVIGGGINGVGIAADAASRGLSVCVCERDDLASHTSNWSTKLIHGGLRYLEHYEFRLVREALIEREVLLSKAPYLMKPLTFVLPHDSSQRPAWLIRLGLFLYDHLGPRKKLHGSKGVSLDGTAYGEILKDEFTKGFLYSDGWVDDARLVVLNALYVQDRGGSIRTRTEAVGATRDAEGWTVRLRDAFTGETSEVRGKAMVNAGGPWVEAILKGAKPDARQDRVRLVKGSHIVVPKLHDHDHAYILQNPDKRIVFIIPFQERFSLIGTTDEPYEGDPAKAAISEAETDYLIGAVNRFLKRPIAKNDIVHTYSGVRPLYNDNADNPSAVTRDYVFDVDEPAGKAPLLSVFGGKLTTYRKLGEHAMDKLAKRFPQAGPSSTKADKLPGGDLPDEDFAAYLTGVRDRHPWLPEDVAYRLTRCYGTRIEDLLDGARAIDDLGRPFGATLYAREVDFLVRHEWARHADDVLWRRTKQGVHLTEEERRRFAEWFERRNAHDEAAE